MKTVHIITPITKEKSLEYRLTKLNDKMLRKALMEMGVIDTCKRWTKELEEEFGFYHKFANEMTRAQLREFKKTIKEK